MKRSIHRSKTHATAERTAPLGAAQLGLYLADLLDDFDAQLLAVAGTYKVLHIALLETSHEDLHRLSTQLPPRDLCGVAEATLSGIEALTVLLDDATKRLQGEQP